MSKECHCELIRSAAGILLVVAGVLAAVIILALAFGG